MYATGRVPNVRDMGLEDAGVKVEKGFIAVDDHRRSHMSPHLFRVTGYGSNWTDLAKAPMDGYALSVRQDHIDPDLIFAGTELGLRVRAIMEAGELVCLPGDVPANVRRRRRNAATRGFRAKSTIRGPTGWSCSSRTTGPRWK